MADVKPYEFTTTPGGQYVISGRGTVYSFPAEQFPDDLWEPRDLKGLTVLVDGEKRIVKGVEAFAIMRSESQPYRLGFGLSFR